MLSLPSSKTEHSGSINSAMERWNVLDSYKLLKGSDVAVPVSGIINISFAKILNYSKVNRVILFGWS